MPSRCTNSRWAPSHNKKTKIGDYHDACPITESGGRCRIMCDYRSVVNATTIPYEGDPERTICTIGCWSESTKFLDSIVPVSFLGPRTNAQMGLHSPGLPGTL